MSKKRKVPLVVSKFGGSSMADLTAMERSAKVALSHNASVVVVSATYGTTDAILNLVALAEEKPWEDCQEALDAICNRHRKLWEEVGGGSESREELESILVEFDTLAHGINLLRDCSAKTKDSIVAVGERLSSCIFTEVMAKVAKNGKEKRKVKLLDVREVLRTDDQYGKARPDLEEIERLCGAHLQACMENKEIIVTQGFIGRAEDGTTTTLGRGGSDYSAALVAEGVHADILEIWTDVAGIASTDPRLCPNARSIPEITFVEAAELANFGAKILHPTTLSPAMRKDIAVYVGSSYDPEAKGTWIRRETNLSPLIRAMALRKNQVLLTISTPRMLQAHGFLYNVFKVFNDHKVSVDLITTSEISVAMTVDDSTMVNKHLLKDLSELGKVQVEDNLSLVSLIGNNIHQTAGLGKDIFSALKDINVRMICSGASKHNFCFLVGAEQGTTAIQRLHQTFIEQGPARMEA